MSVDEADRRCRTFDIQAESRMPERSTLKPITLGAPGTYDSPKHTVEILRHTAVLCSAGFHPRMDPEKGGSLELTVGTEVEPMQSAAWNANQVAGSDFNRQYR